MSSDSHGHPKHARLEELEGMIRDGRIDTLVVAITDMQGRLMGKRVQAQAFLDGVIDHGAHFCTYLLGTDMEMNTPEGFRLMNWETGYGDWIATPVWDTLRVLPWLEKTAIVRSRRPRSWASSSRPARNSSTTSCVTAGTTWPARATSRPSGSGRTTRTTTCSRRPRPSSFTGSCAIR